MITLINGLFYEVKVDKHSGVTRNKLLGFDFSTLEDRNFLRTLQFENRGSDMVEVLAPLIPLTLYRVNDNSSKRKDDTISIVKLESIKARGKDNYTMTFSNDGDDTGKVYEESTPHKYLTEEMMRTLNIGIIPGLFNMFEKKVDQLTIENNFANGLFKNINIAIQEKDNGH